MQKYDCLKKLWKKSFAEPKIWIIFPFTIYALMFSLAYLYIFCFYMLIDYVTIEIRKLLNEDSEKIGDFAKGIKYFIGFIFYFMISVFKIIFSVPMAVLYFLTTVFLFISSLGAIKENPFAFHEIECKCDDEKEDSPVKI